MPLFSPYLTIIILYPILPVHKFATHSAKSQLAQNSILADTNFLIISVSFQIAHCILNRVRGSLHRGSLPELSQ